MGDLWMCAHMYVLVGRAPTNSNLGSSEAPKGAKTRGNNSQEKP